MASMTDPTRALDESGLYEARLVEHAQRIKALSLLLTGRESGAGAAVDHFLQFTSDQGLDTSRLWALYHREKPIAAALIVPSAGKTAMIFLSPMHELSMIGPVEYLIRHVMAEVHPQEINLVQALLEPGQHYETQALHAADFTTLAHLIYMQSPVRAGAQALSVQPPMSVHTWQPQDRDRFARAILASYEQTLDCPGLLGLRAVNDIIDGHMATGQFDPNLWMVIEHDGQPAAVMLLTHLMQRNALEMVYLGVSVPFRGTGLAGQLVEHIHHLAHKGRQSDIYLAVDEHNTPALKLYQRHGYKPQARKTALIYAHRRAAE